MPCRMSQTISSRRVSLSRSAIATSATTGVGGAVAASDPRGARKDVDGAGQRAGRASAAGAARSYQASAARKSAGNVAAGVAVASEPSRMRCMRSTSSAQAACGSTSAGGTRWQPPQAAAGGCAAGGPVGPVTTVTPSSRHAQAQSQQPEACSHWPAGCYHSATIDAQAVRRFRPSIGAPSASHVPHRPAWR